MTISDEVFRVTGLGSNDGQAEHYGRTTSESLEDAELRFVNALLTTKQAHVNDAWFQLGKEQVFASAQINDIKLEYWEGQ